MAAYEEARRVALGLERAQNTQAGDDIWNISLEDPLSSGGGFGLSAQMPYQFFERGFEAPDEVTAQKSALMLYEEYGQDQVAALEKLERLESILSEQDSEKLSKLMDEAPVEEWLSYIFLENEMIRDGLVPALDGTDADCKAGFAKALDQALERLVEFRDLLSALREHC